VKVYRITPIPTPTPSGKRYVYYGGGEEAPLEDRSTTIRLNVEWPRAIRAFLKNPLLGTGYSSITLATDNDYLRALGEVGLFGFLAFVFILVKIGLEARKIVFSKIPIEVEKAVLIGLVGGALGFLANALFIDVFEASKVAITFWLLMGLLIGITRVSFAKGKIK
jgi:O-antigen ligase